MTDLEFGSYVEALNALGMVETRHREALRKAVEASTATQQQAKTQMADQQRMYDRTGQELRQAEDLLAELRTMLGLARTPSTKPTPQAGTPPQLVEVRTRIRGLVSWAEESKPIAESLLRTKARLASAPKRVEHASSPVEEAHERTLPVSIIVAVLVLVVVVLLIAVVAVIGT